MSPLRPGDGGVRAALFDIEGTISPITFVKDVLFPLAAARLPAFVAAHGGEPAIEEALARVRAEADGDPVAALLGWIAADRKHPVLKDIQGQIWREAYARGEIVAPLYADVAPAFDRLAARGVTLAIYSSGSVLAQQLFLRHSSEGDLTANIAGWFDLAVGPKGDARSYSVIAERLGVSPAAMTFFTDVPAEVDAARAAGGRAVQLVRPGTLALADGERIASFDELA